MEEGEEWRVLRIHQVYMKTHTHIYIYPHEAEAMALLAALSFSWIGDLHLQNMVIESDCKMVVDGLMQQSANVTEFGSIIDKCKQKLISIQNCSAGFIRRQTNQVAHKIIVWFMLLVVLILSCCGLAR